MHMLQLSQAWHDMLMPTHAVAEMSNASPSALKASGPNDARSIMCRAFISTALLVGPYPVSFEMVA